MAALAELLDDGQAAKLARLALHLATAPPPAAPPTAAVCGECGRPYPPQAAVFREPEPMESDPARPSP